MLTEEEMHDILETPIPSELFSDYYRNIIDNSLSSRKNVELVLNRRRRKAYNLEVINTEDRIILKEKVNKKNYNIILENRKEYKIITKNYAYN